MSPGAARAAELRGLDQHRQLITLNRRCSALLSAQTRRAEKLRTKEHVDIAPPNFSLDQLRSFIQQALGAHCKYCGKTLTVDNFELDHEIPIDRGGQMTLENMAVITGPCNKKKGSLTNIEYEMLLNLLNGFPKEARADVLQRLGTGGRMFR